MKDSIASAIRNIAEFGDTDIFPYSFERHVFRDRPDLLQKALEALHKDFATHLAEFEPDNVNTLAPVGYTGFRWATQIDPLWNAYYLSLVLEMADAIEKERIPLHENTIFSYRIIKPQPEGSIFNEKVTWKVFMETSRELATSYPFVIVCDIVDKLLGSKDTCFIFLQGKPLIEKFLRG